uniref:Uncharacterized protein n=1 Tax=Setaria italica TaxID=4555 RepID=K3YF39_SETIT
MHCKQDNRFKQLHLRVSLQCLKPHTGIKNC